MSISLKFKKQEEKRNKNPFQNTILINKGKKECVKVAKERYD